MSQQKQPGYPLPSGELGEDEIVCQLVYLPNRDEYWQALLAAVHYMSTWRAWERDADKRGRDAAANWRDAFELTMECWRMTCLEDLTQTVTDILELLQTKKDCCDSNVTYLPQEEVETDIEPNEGDPPETYGETEVADWDEWNEYLCYSAHKYVDYLAHVGVNLLAAAATKGIVIGVIAAALTLLAASGIGLPIAFAAAAAITSGLVLGGTALTFADSEASIEAARDDIVCAIMLNEGLADAVENALSSGLDWDLFYQWIPYGTALAIMYEGGHDGEYLPAVTRDDCECEEVFGDEYGIWVNGGPGQWEALFLQSIVWSVWEAVSSNKDSDNPRMVIEREHLDSEFGITNVNMRVSRMEFDYAFFTHGQSTYPDWEIYLEIPSGSGSTVTRVVTLESDVAWDEWHHCILEDVDLPNYIITDEDRNVLSFHFIRHDTHLGRTHALKNVELWISYT